MNLLRQTTTRYIHRVPTQATHRRFLATIATSPVQEAAVASFFPDEPSMPQVITSIPGPASKRIMSKLNQYQDTRSIFFVAGKINYYGWTSEC
jgi:4-aminobutyrate aminotransferase/(S)-3-amino-2-methylpropionate transaminase